MPAAKRNSIATVPQARPSLGHSKAVAAAPSTRSTRKSLGSLTTVAPSPLPTLMLSTTTTTSSRPFTRSLIRASLDGSSVISYGSSSSSTVSSLVSTATASTSATTPSHARDTLAALPGRSPGAPAAAQWGAMGLQLPLLLPWPPWT